MFMAPPPKNWICSGRFLSSSQKSEVEMLMSAGAKCMTLGRRILRTETAGMALLAHLMLRLELENT